MKLQQPLTLLFYLFCIHFMIEESSEEIVHLTTVYSLSGSRKGKNKCGIVHMTLENLLETWMSFFL